MRIALCNEVIAPMPFPRQCEYASKLGYDGLEIAPYTLSDEPHRMGSGQIAAARAAAREAGIEVTGLHWLLIKPAGLSISSKDEKIRQRTLDVMLALIDQCAELGGRYLVHGSPHQRRIDPGETRACRNAARRGVLCGRGGARAESGRRLLHRAALGRADAAHQYARGSRRDRRAHR
jgi:sugar phosphate isomerase/epimerase